MQNYSGQNVRLFISTTIENERFLIGGQRDATLNINVAELDNSSKDTIGGWGSTIAGQRSWDVSCSGVAVVGDRALEILDDSIMATEHTPTLGRFELFLVNDITGETRTGFATLTSKSEASPHTDLVTYSLSFNGAGPLKKITALPQMQSFNETIPNEAGAKKEVKK